MQTDWHKGLALFNSGRYFEAHEALEDIWREAPRSSARKRHLQGLVQLAVAFHHQSTGNYIGGRSVLERALRNLDGAEKSYPQLDWKRLRAGVEPWRDFLKAKTKNTHAMNKFESSFSSEITPPSLPKLLLRRASTT